MGRPRISIRWLMAAVLGLALSLGLGLPATEFYWHSRVHLHAYVGLSDGRPFYGWDQGITPAFWPSYWRRLASRPEFERGDCGAGHGRLAETCSLAHPEVVGELICRGPAMKPTPEMIAAFERLEGQMNQKPAQARRKLDSPIDRNLTMKWPRLSTRRIMLVVVLAALALGLGLPAWEVSRDHECHVHAWIDRLDPLHSRPTYESSTRVILRSVSKAKGPPAITKVTYILETDQVEMPFWPRYWRCLRGLPWKMRKGCHPVGTQVELICEMEHPEICHRNPPGPGPRLILSYGPPDWLFPMKNRLEAGSRDH